VSGVNRVKLLCPVCGKTPVSRDYPSGLPTLADFICEACVKDGKTKKDIPSPSPEEQEMIDWLMGTVEEQR